MPEPTNDAYQRLMALLHAGQASYRIIDHAPEGQTDAVSKLRGHPVKQAAKCLVLIVKLGKKVTRFVLSVVPGDARVDTAKIKQLYGATYVGFAGVEQAEKLAGSVAGTVLPFAFHPDLEIIADPALLDSETIFFNAARLDRSLELPTSDYLALARPRLERIVQAA
jgi:Ala-tRNA(Pro) deacylase